MNIVFLTETPDCAAVPREGRGVTRFSMEPRLTR